MTNCLWCKKEIPDGNFFCLGGGLVTRGRSATGEGHFTKSYCFHSFLNGIRMLSKEPKWEATKDETQYFLNEETIKEWYKTIPHIDHDTIYPPKVPTGLMGVGFQDGKERP